MTTGLDTREDDGIKTIMHSIFEIRGLRVMMDRDLANLYGVETRRLNEAVKRNLDRFPDDFMFQLKKEEWEFLRQHTATSNMDDKNLMSQIATSSWGGMRKLPYVFTEHGAIMLASVLHSPLAVQMSVMVTRAFIAMREAISGMLSMNMRMEQLSHKVDLLNAQVEEILHSQEESNIEVAVQIEAINDALDQLRAKKETPYRRIGFMRESE